jgi:hypothetical protein
MAFSILGPHRWKSDLLIALEKDLLNRFRGDRRKVRKYVDVVAARFRVLIASANRMAVRTPDLDRVSFADAMQFADWKFANRAGRF